VGGFIHPFWDGRRTIQNSRFAAIRQDEDYDGREYATTCENRRRFVFHTLGCLSGVWSSVFSHPLPAQARGLVSFPCVTPLLNVYHLMHAGTTLLEEQDIWTTNPLFLTNRESALSQRGIDEVREACHILQAADINPSVVKYSLAASAIDSAMIIRDELKVGQNRMIPEFTFMDPRAIGGWDMMSLRDTYPAIVALDDEEAGTQGTGARPPPNIDGTPNDTLADQAIRLRQLMSVLETQFSGDTIVLVFPDSSSPALLSAMIAGIPYNKAHVLDFSPGEIRLDVTMASTLQLYQTKSKSSGGMYDTLVESGKTQLATLRSIDEQDLVSKKDQLIEKERMEIEQEYRQKEAARQAKEERQRQADLVRINEARSAADASDPSSTYAAAVVGAAFAGYAAMASSTRDDRTESDREQMGSDNVTDTPIVPSMQTRGATISTSLGSAAPAGDTDTREPYRGIYEPRVRSDEERLAAAREAMQTYLDQDDGGLAWLQVMADIVDEDDDEDLDP